MNVALPRSGFAEADAGALLGVARSFRGRRWRERLDASGRATAAEIGRDHGTPEMLARVLAGRGVVSADLPNHLNPSIRAMMPDPYRLVDMEKATARLADAVGCGEAVAVLGDYDVDGATSAALLALYLRAAGLDVRTHIPDRLFEGYGPNVEAVRMLHRGGARLLVTVDCGTTSIDALAEARRLGLDVVVIDHHQAGVDLPPAHALVNPNRQDDLSGYGHLAAVGVVFLTLVALNRELRRRGVFAGRAEPDLLAALDLVALGTVADVVPLTGLNRAFVLKGLIALRQRGREGLRALMDVARLDGPPTPYHLGFLLGPRINAGGRIGRADLGVDLLTASDPLVAEGLAGELDRLNTERRDIEQRAIAEAFAQAERGGDAGMVVVSSEAWHPGIVGLVAARLKDRFCRPAFVFAVGRDGCATGSGRSVLGVDLGRAVREAVAAGLALKGGGHAMAAGATIPPCGLPAFAAFLDEMLGADIALARDERVLDIDAIVTARAATADLVETLELAGPFGSGNPEPVVVLAAHRLESAQPVGDGGHIRFRLCAGDGASLNGIAFRAANEPLGIGLLERRGRDIHAAGHLCLDRWGGQARVQLRLTDAAEAGPGFDARGDRNRFADDPSGDSLPHRSR